MITRNLLTAKGTIDALTALNDFDIEGTHDLAMLAAEMDVAKGTARNRLDSLIDQGLVAEDADIVDERPQRVFTLTEPGEELATQLGVIIEDETEVTAASDE